MMDIKPHASEHNPHQLTVDQEESFLTDYPTIGYYRISCFFPEILATGHWQRKYYMELNGLV